MFLLHQKKLIFRSLGISHGDIVAQQGENVIGRELQSFKLPWLPKQLWLAQLQHSQVKAKELEMGQDQLCRYLYR